MNEFVSLILGIFLFYVSVECVNYASRQRKIKRRANWNSSNGEELLLESARLQDDLQPLVSSLNLRGSKITMVEDESVDLSASRIRHLQSALKSWILKGAEVEYLLLGEGNDIAKTDDWLQRLSQSGNSFKYFRINCPTSTEYDGFRQILILHHPILISTSSGNAMWEESYRIKGGIPSFDVRWIPPSAMNEIHLATYQNYRQIFEKLVKFCVWKSGDLR